MQSALFVYALSHFFLDCFLASCFHLIVKHKREDVAFSYCHFRSGHSYWFCRASAGEPPCHERAHTEFSLRWKGFLVLSHIMLPLPTLYVFSLSFCTHAHTHTLEKVHGTVRHCIAGHCHNLCIQAKPPQPLTFTQSVFLLVEIASLSHHFPTATLQHEFEVSLFSLHGCHVWVSVMKVSILAHTLCKVF